MGEPKQKWTAEEEAALKARIGKHRARKWCTILKDPEFRNILRYRSNVDLKDKYRNMNVTVNASGSRDKVRTMVTTMPTAKKPRSAPKQESHSTAITTITSDGHDDVVDVKPIIKPIAVKTLNEPTRSYKTSVANSSEQYWPPADFDHVLSAKLNELTSSWKLMKAVTFLSTIPSGVEIFGSCCGFSSSEPLKPLSQFEITSVAFGINCRVGNAML
ncbi:hypothetical protein ZWY2020_031750 [Hordeum vulgare]|nr:hypothetical protein ZWY2020_031750 [Hordeum vulgare]